MIRVRHLLVLIALVAISKSGFSWGQTGHRAVAEICMRHLSEDAQAEIKSMLGKDFLTELSTWPDYIKSEDKWDFAKQWHYINVDPPQTLDEVIAEAAADPEINNALEALDLMEAVLKGDAKKTAEFAAILKEHEVEPLKGSLKATALAFFIHCMGDLHQPLHVGMKQDKGGNSVKVKYFWESKNLHSVWDSGIIDQEQLSFTELADYADDASEEELKQLRTGNYASWADESLKHRIEIYVYYEALLADEKEDEEGKKRTPALSYEYQHDHKPLMEERIEAAGVRSAMVLNRIFQQ